MKDIYASQHKLESSKQYPDSNNMFKKVASFFIVWRIYLFVASYIASLIVPYAGFFPYKEILPSFHLPDWISSFANFDGLHYILLAENGYSQFEQAFFPLFFLAIRLFKPLFANNTLLAALTINFFASIGAIYFLIQLLKKLNYSRTTSIFLFLFIGLYPFSFFLGAVYTEPFFFLFSFMFLDALLSKKYFQLALGGFLLGLTRLTGVFILVVPTCLIAYEIWKSNTGKKPILVNLFAVFREYIQTNWKYLIALSMPAAGLLTYMTFLQITTGDALFFFNSQPAFGANRSTNLILLPQVYFRYLKIFITAAHTSQYWISVAEFVTFTFAVCVLLWEWRGLLPLKKSLGNLPTPFRAGLNLYSILSLLLPTLTGTFSSTTRYVVTAYAVFFVLADIKNKAVKITLLVLFYLFQNLFLMLFVRGYFVG